MGYDQGHRGRLVSHFIKCLFNKTIKPLNLAVLNNKVCFLQSMSGVLKAREGYVPPTTIFDDGKTLLATPKPLSHQDTSMS